MSSVNESIKKADREQELLFKMMAEYFERHWVETAKNTGGLRAELARSTFVDPQMIVSPHPRAHSPVDETTFRVDQIDGQLLDCLTAIALGLPADIAQGRCVVASSGIARMKALSLPRSEDGSFNPSTNWTLCGRLLDLYPITFSRILGNIWATVKGSTRDGVGKSMLVAVCRAIIAHELADSEGFICIPATPSSGVRP